MNSTRQKSGVIVGVIVVITVIISLSFLISSSHAYDFASDCVVCHTDGGTASNLAFGPYVSDPTWHTEHYQRAVSCDTCHIGPNSYNDPPRPIGCKTCHNESPPPIAVSLPCDWANNHQLNYGVSCLSCHAVSHDCEFTLILPDSGQAGCYDNERMFCDEWHMEGSNQVCDSPPYCPEPGEDFWGQDGIYTINPPDLTDNGDGTVADNLTGLTWEQKTQINEPNVDTYNDAIFYCDNLTLGGQNDWRVPTLKEYSTILNYGRVSPSMDTTYFPYYSIGSPGQGYYWTTSGYHDDASKVWRIFMPFGLMEVAPDKTVEVEQVRCVRGNALPESTYTDLGDETVIDNVTGLIWEQKTDDNGSRDKDNTYNWLDALNYCNDLVLGGSSNWRLPNTKELERLVDLGSSSPAIDTTYFPNTNSGYYWTGTTCAGCHKKKAHTYDFTDGVSTAFHKIQSYYVRCVRVLTTDDDGIPYQIDNLHYVASGSNSLKIGRNLTWLQDS